MKQIVVSFYGRAKDTTLECTEQSRIIIDQFQRYEIAPEDIEEIEEGKEFKHFWSILGGIVEPSARHAPLYQFPPLPFNAEQARGLAHIETNRSDPDSIAKDIPNKISFFFW